MSHADRIILLLLICWMAQPTGAIADSETKLVSKGNRAYRAGDFEGAAAAYDAASKAAPESPLVWFNLGDARYRKGDFANAAAAFEQAALRSNEPAFSARIQHNLGNSCLRDAERRRGSDLAKALASCEQSIAHFDKAVAADAKFRDAAANLEIARTYLEDLRLDSERQESEKQKQAAQSQQQKESPEKDQNESGNSQSSAPSQNPASEANASPPRMKSKQPMDSAQTRPNRPESSSSAKALAEAEQTINRIRQQQQAFRQSLQNQLGSGRLPQMLSMQFQFSATQFGHFPGLRQGSDRPLSSEPLTDQPQDILKEEKENRRLRELYKPRAAEPSVEKDW